FLELDRNDEAHHAEAFQALVDERDRQLRLLAEGWIADADHHPAALLRRQKVQHVPGEEIVLAHLWMLRHEVEADDLVVRPDSFDEGAAARRRLDEQATVRHQSPERFIAPPGDWNLGVILV